MDPQALEDLSASIAQHGVLTPVLFRVDDTQYQPEGGAVQDPSASALHPRPQKPKCLDIMKLLMS